MRLINAYAVRCDRDEFDTYADYIKAFDAINEAPTVDAVPVIRCKDCKWFGKIGCAVNIVDESDEPKENDYCSWAERKEE